LGAFDNPASNIHKYRDRDNAASVHVHPPLAVGGNILIKFIMLYVYSFAIVRLSVLTRPNPDMSRSRARGRSDSAHECRRRIKIVDCKGVIAKRSVPDSSYSPLHTTDETGLQYHLPARLLACRGARTRHITLWRRGRSREARPHNLVSAMQRFASESATSQASQGMSGARIRKRPFYLSSSATPTDSAVIRQTPT